VRSFSCPHCEAVNYLDERGEITDPPIEVHTTSVQYARPAMRATSPELASPDQELFCRECLKNQYMLTQALAEYLPPPNHPDYHKFEASIEQYRQDLEHRYPQVCADCLPKVRNRIRAAGYAAKTDHLRRNLEKTRKGFVQYGYSRWGWRNVLLFVAKQIYFISILLGVMWHAFGALMRAEDEMREEDGSCMLRAFRQREVEPRCFEDLFEFAKWGWLCGLLTCWWNPKLSDKANGSGGRFRGLRTYLTLQAVVLAVRGFSLWHLQSVSLRRRDALSLFKAEHAFMTIFIVITTAISLRLVRIDYSPLFSFNDTIEPTLPSPPRRTNNTHQPFRSSFDTMAESFTDTFPIDRLGEGSSSTAYASNVQYPPSPTITSLTSESLRDDDSQTTISDSHDRDELMDWTPTRPTFHSRVNAQRIPFGQPQLYQQSQQPLSPPKSFIGAPLQPQNTNPFHGTLPPAPKVPAHKVANPFPAPLVKNVTESERSDFFSRMMVSQGSEEARQGLLAPKPKGHEWEIQEGKMKWVEQPAVTGLETMFESVFSVEDGAATPVAHRSPLKAKVGITGGQTVADVNVGEPVSLPGKVGRGLLAASVPVAICAGMVVWNGWY
jgi:hypothetical protein